MQGAWFFSRPLELWYLVSITQVPTIWRTLATDASKAKLANEDHERDAESQGTLPPELNVPAFIGSLNYSHRSILVSLIAEFRITFAYPSCFLMRIAGERRLIDVMTVVSFLGATCGERMGEL